MKKILNLDFVELGELEANNEVCLMPCPCSDSYSSVTYSYSGTGGNIACGGCHGRTTEDGRAVNESVVTAVATMLGVLTGTTGVDQAAKGILVGTVVANMDNLGSGQGSIGGDGNSGPSDGPTPGTGLGGR